MIDTGTDKRYIRCDADGKFKESIDVSRSLSADEGSSHPRVDQADPRIIAIPFLIITITNLASEQLRFCVCF